MVRLALLVPDASLIPPSLVNRGRCAPVLASNGAALVVNSCVRTPLGWFWPDWKVLPISSPGLTATLNLSAVARIRILVGENLVLLMFREYPDGLGSVDLGRYPLLVSIPSFLTSVLY